MKVLTIMLIKMLVTSSTLGRLTVRHQPVKQKVLKQRLLTLPEYIKTLPPIDLPRPKPKPTVRLPRSHDMR